MDPAARDKLENRYLAAMHAMQTGVKLWLSKQAPQYELNPLERVPESQECSPKHLRVGVNSAMIEFGALQKVLIEKGIITEEEFFEALVEVAEAEVKSYRDKLDLPPNVHLG